jgi:WD40 repeat protein
MPVSLDVVTAQKRFVAFAVSSDKKMLAVGGMGECGWLTIIDLQQGKTVLEKEYKEINEFTSAVFTPDGSRMFLTNHNGSVYGIDTGSGEIKSSYTVLKPGEKNIVTNDTSSQNAVISADGRYVAAVMIERKVAVWDIQSGNLVFEMNPGHKLAGSIALSEDGSLLATSDKRSDGAVRIWKVKK